FKNFIPLMNYMFGSQAKSLEELSRAFSHHKRRIIFKKDVDCFYRFNAMTILLQTPGKPEEELRLVSNKDGSHAILMAYRFSDIEKPNIPLGLHGFLHRHIDRFTLLFLAVAMKENNIFNYFSKKDHVYMMSYFFPENTLEAFEFLRQSIKEKLSSEKIELYAMYLHKKYPELLEMAMDKNDMSVADLLQRIGG